LDVPGEYRFTLTVNDGARSTSASIEPVNAVPFYRKDIERSGYDFFSKDFVSDKVMLGSRDYITAIPFDVDSPNVTFEMPVR